MKKYIDKNAILIEIDNLRDCANEHWDNEEVKGVNKFIDKLLPFLNTLEIWDIDLDSLGELARHLIATHAHDIKPRYEDKELELLERIGYRPDKNV